MMNLLPKFSRPGHSNVEKERDRTRREEERRQNQLRAQQSIANEVAYDRPAENPYDDNFGQLAIRSQDQSREDQSPKQKRVAHRIKRKPHANRDHFHSQPNEITHPKNQRQPERSSLRDDFNSQPLEYAVPSDGSYSQRSDRSRFGDDFNPLQPKAMSLQGQSSSRELVATRPKEELNLQRSEKMQPRGDSYTRRTDARRTSEPDQNFDIGQPKNYKSSFSRVDGSLIQGSGGKSRNRNVPPIESASHEEFPNSPLLPRIEEAGDISENWLSLITSGVEASGTWEKDGDSGAVVERILKQLHKVKIEHPSKYFGNNIPKRGLLEDIEKAVQDLIRAYGSVCQSFYESENALSNLKTEYTLLQTRYEEEWTKWTNNTGDLEARVSTLTEEAKRERERTSIVRDEYAIREKAKEAIIIDNEVRIKQLEGEIEQSENKYKSEISQLRKNHQEQLDDLEFSNEQFTSKTIRDCEHRLNDLIQEHKAEKLQIASQHQISDAELERKFQEEKEALEVSMEHTNYQYQVQIANMKKSHELEIARKVEELETMKRSHKIQTEQMNEKHQAEIEQMKELHEDEKIKLENKREEEHRSLKNDVVELTGALVKRDHFKPMSDHELARRFQNVASEADEFARVRWDNRRQSTWPFTDRVLHNSENERRTKQYVIQNTIWVILYERIFCSPFQIFGNRGKSLIQEWIKQFGQDRKSTGALARCPKPTKDSEIWRYETMKQCLDDIGQLPLKEKSNHNLKQEYELSLSAAVDDICHELERVSSVSSSDRQRMDDFVRKAAKLWLEAGQQRYRVFLLMSDAGENPSRSGSDYLNNEGTQDLIVAPELRRLGNAQGERLERDELVRDCKGKFSMIQAH